MKVKKSLSYFLICSSFRTALGFFHIVQVTLVSHTKCIPTFMGYWVLTSSLIACNWNIEFYGLFIQHVIAFEKLRSQFPKNRKYLMVICFFTSSFYPIKMSFFSRAKWCKVWMSFKENVDQYLWIDDIKGQHENNWKVKQSLHVSQWHRKVLAYPFSGWLTLG